MILNISYIKTYGDSNDSEMEHENPKQHNPVKLWRFKWLRNGTCESHRHSVITYIIHVITTSITSWQQKKKSTKTLAGLHATKTLAGLYENIRKPGYGFHHIMAGTRKTIVRFYTKRNSQTTTTVMFLHQKGTHKATKHQRMPSTTFKTSRDFWNFTTFSNL